MFQKKDKLSIIIPVYNEESCITELLSRLIKLSGKLESLETEFIFINDGSTDRSLELLSAYAKENKIVKIINFSRNFGHQIALTAGLDYSKADYAVIIDADLQDPLELIEDMYRKAKEGYDIVYGKRIARRGENIFKLFTAKVFYKFISIMCDVEIPGDTGDFRLINRKVLDAIKQLREKHRFIRGMIPWVGFRSVPFYYNRDERYAGKTKFLLRKMMRFALDGVFSFSNVPIRLTTYFGLLLVGLGALGAILILYLRFFTKYSVPGISAVILTVIIIGGFQIIMMGIIGEYVGRIFEESKKRPLYLVDETVNIAE